MSLVALNELITFQRGFDLPERSRKDGSIPVVASTSTVGYHSESKVEAPGVVIGRSGSVGGGQYVNEDFWPLNTTLWVKDFKGNIPRYIYYLCKSIDFKALNAGAGVPTLNRNHLSAIKIKERTLDQQKSIVNILSNYDDLIENNNRRIALLEESARLLYQEWFFHLRFPGHEHCKIIDGVPEGWVKGTVSDLFQVKNGYAFKSKDWREEGNPVIKIKNIAGSGLIDLNGCQCIDDSIAEKALRFQIYPQDVLIAMTGATIGKVGIMPRTNSSYFLNQRVGRFEPKLRADSVNFIYLSSKFDFFKKAVLNLAGGAAQPNISGSQIESIKLIVPQEKILNLFLDEVKASFQQRQVLIELNSKLTEVRDILLPRLMNGEIVV